jgi:hypothetical protein
MTRRSLVFIVVAIVLAIVAFGVGQSLGQRSALRQSNVQLDGVQAMLLVDRILEERKLQSFLTRGCLTEATSAVDINISSDLRLLAEFANSGLDQPTEAYIAKRDPHILKEARALKSKYGHSWPEVECSK